MIRWTRPLLAVLLAFAAFGSHAQTCTTTISPGGDITANVAAMSAGQVLCLNAGTYAPPSPGFPSNGSFAIGNGVIVRGLGAGPASVVLQATNAADHAVYFTNYLNNGKVASSAQLINLTIQGSPGGIQVFNFTNLPAGRLTDIKFKDVVINTTGNAGVFGVLLRNADRIVLDNVTASSRNTVLNFIDVTDSVVMNSTIPNTIAEAAAALSVQGGSGNRFINNSIGQVRSSSGAGYSFNGGGVVFYNTSDNRFENNVLQGMRDDALDYSIVDLSSLGIPLQRSLNNYVGKNRVIHTAFALNGSVLGSAGIWSNCASDGSWIYGNDVQGAAECGICSWGSKSNMILGNWNHNNGISGIFVSGGQEAVPFCTPAGNTSFQQKPVSTFLMGNGNWFNKNEQVVVRNADLTTISRNFESPNNGRTGPLQACTNPACQSAYSIETDGGAFGTSSGTRILGNTSVSNFRGLWIDFATVTGVEFYLNRIINSTNSRYVTGSTQNIDRGSVLGGNYWTQWIPNGNPSNGQPYTGVFHNTSNNTGLVVDRYPYQSENLGRGFNVAVFEPRASSSIAQGTRRTVRWESIGCVYFDIALHGTNLATDAPNTGYAVVTIPGGAGTGATSLQLTCKDGAGAVRAVVNSPTFTITPNSLQILSPGRDDVFNASQQIWVTWKNTNPATTTINIDYSSDGGATFPTTLATINNVNTNPVTSTRVTLPGTGTAYAMLRVRAGTSIDQTDGVFSVRGATGALTNVNAGRVFVMGQTERLEWSSPAGSRLVSITAVVGGNPQVVATDLPDRGSYDWVVPDYGLAATMSITLNFKTITGAAVGAPVVNATSGVTRYATTITWGTPPGIGPGSSAPIPVSTNSGAGVTVTTLTPSICTVSGSNTINGVANGTCALAANAPAANGNFVAALQSTITFTLGGTQTINFPQPQGYIAVGASIALVASASSGGPITFSSLTPGVCSISGSNVLTGNTVGTCTVAADQPGFGGFGAAARVQRNLQSVAAANIPRLANISTRMQVLTGNDVLIGGFVIGGGTPKTIVVRARGPSLTPLGVPGALANPVLQLYQGQTVIAANDNWQSAANAATLQASGFAPPDPLEAAIYTAIGPGPFTAIVTGAGGSTGVGLIEVFEVDHPELPLVNIATRGQVLTGADVMIAGFIIQGQAAQQVVVRARGPSLTAQGVPGALANPRLQLFQGQTEISNNDNWQTAANASQLQSIGFAPSDPLESAILTTLAPGAYTAIVTGVSNSTGVGIVEVFGVP